MLLVCGYGGRRMLANYPVFVGVEVEDPGDKDFSVLAGVKALVFPYASSVELTPPAGVSLGEVALTEDDGRGGYWVVVRVSADPPAAADQYEVLHVRAGRRIKAFAVSSRSFADVPPMARFVLGRDGALYQMTSSPEFLRVLRYDLGEER